MITKTVGVGGDYATLKTCFDAMPTPISDDYTISIIGTVTETASPVKTIGNTARGIKIVGVTPNNGILSSGSKIILSGSSVITIVGPSNASESYVTINDIEIYENTISLYAGTNSFDRKLNINYNRCIFNSCIVDSGLANDAADFNISNCVFYRSSGTGNRLLRIQRAPYNGTVYVENCSFYGASYGIELSNGGAGIVPDVTLKNTVLAMVQGGLNISYGTAHATYSASSDTSLPAGTGNVSSIVPANEFISLDSTSSSFLIPKRAGTIYKLGTIPTLSSVDIAGLSIPTGFGEYPIGCHVAPGDIDFIGVPTSGMKPLNVQFTDLSTM